MTNSGGRHVMKARLIGPSGTRPCAWCSVVRGHPHAEIVWPPAMWTRLLRERRYRPSVAEFVEVGTRRHGYFIAGGATVLVGLNLFAAISPHPGGWYFLLYASISLVGFVLIGVGLALLRKTSRERRRPTQDTP
jgi:hypothetical protein